MNERGAEPAAPNVGKRIRTLREQHGLSLRALAERCGLSVNTISLIERGVNSPTVASLNVLAAALNVPITEFFRSEHDRTTVHVRRGERVRFQRQDIDIESLGAGLRDQHLEPFMMTIPAGTREVDPHPVAHGGQEFVYCLEGLIDYEVARTTYRLEPGDALLFEAAQPHRCLNAGTTDARVLFVFSSRDGHQTARSHHLGS